MQKPSQNRQKIGQSWQKEAKRSKIAKRSKKEQKYTGKKWPYFHQSVYSLCTVHRAVNVPFVRDAQPVVVRGGEVFAAAATVAQYIAHAAGAAVGFVGVVHHLESG